MAVNRQDSVRVKGLDELRRELKKLDDDGSPTWTRKLRDANKEVAQLIVDRARPRMSSLSRMGARAADTLRASNATTGARLSLGSNAVPFAQGVEFGAHRDRERRVGARTIIGWRQFQPWRGSSGNTGYALFPTIRESEGDIVNAYDKAVRELMRDAFPD